MNKEMTIVWHDLIEDPNDLPPVRSNSKVWSEKVYVQTKSGCQILAEYRHGVNEEDGWYNNDFITKLNEDNIVAWTYIPRYYSREKLIDDLISKLPNVVEFYRIRKGKSEVYPKSGQFVILFHYKDGEGIVSGVGFYDKNLGWMITPSIHAEQLIDVDNMIGWSPFIEIKE